MSSSAYCKHTGVLSSEIMNFSWRLNFNVIHIVGLCYIGAFFAMYQMINLIVEHILLIASLRLRFSFYYMILLLYDKFYSHAWGNLLLKYFHIDYFMWSVCSPTVRIIAFQAIDPGSTPGRRNYVLKHF